MKQLNKLMKNKSKAHGYRFTVGRVLQIVLALVFLVFTGRFLYLSISRTVDGQDLAERTNQLYRKKQVLKATRGTIYDRNGITLAEDSHAFTVYAILDHSAIDYHNKPMYVVNKRKTARKLAEVLPISAERIYDYLTPKHRSYQVEFGTAGSNLTIRERKKIESFHLPGIKFVETPARLYPNGTFASHTIGLAQQIEGKKQSTDLVGTMGLEKYFNKQLAGKDGYEETFATSSSQNTSSPQKDGNSMYLTLDFQMESYLEQLMSQVYKSYEPKKLTAVVEDIKTGKVLAISQRPTFNPQTKKGLNSSWSDATVQDSYEPGSVFKVLSLAAAIQSGHYNPNETFKSGSITIGGSTIHDWNNTGWGVIPFSQAFPRSSNVGMSILEQKMGAQTWRSYLDKFHIGQKTGVTLPGEVPGILAFKNSTDQAVTSFGQGVNVTVMQMMQAFSSLGNDGQMVKPQFVNKIVSPSGKTIASFHRQKVGQPVYDTNTHAQLLQNMKRVLDPEYGTGAAYAMPGKSIGVKTGTAQIAGRHGYLTGANNYIFSVVGVTPLNNPRYCIYITMQQPHKMTQDPETILASIFKPMMNRIILSATKNAVGVNSKVKVPLLVGKKASQAKEQAASLNVQQIGNGQTVISQSVPQGSEVNRGSRIFINTGGTIKVPNMSGWDQQTVQAFAQTAGIKLTISGKGQVKKQGLRAGSTLAVGSALTVNLEE
ncbi:MAG: penicillin-binding transpeptidase domain-containing protein [Lactobacillus sp.]